MGMTDGAKQSETEAYNTLVNDALIGFVSLVNQNRPYIYNKRKSDFELNILESVYKISKYPSKEIKKYICLIGGLNYKAVNVWFQNRRNALTGGKVDPDEEEMECNFLGRSNSDWTRLNTINLADQYYTSHDLGEFIKNNTFIKRKDARLFMKIAKCSRVIAEEFARLEHLEQFRTCESDMINMFMQKGIELKTKLRKFYFGSNTNEKLNNDFLDTDYLMSTFYSNLSKQNQKLFLKLRRR
ncbi:hypothetical protein ECANGB1_935 [Enterospora canceri]|uniref:Homeobox domain-containing protein n=1 Tax=Enterospora canceri TaxID=1081671 RepID=A0A1Y1S778_9MICR|nr:hypothetical protein ECANGB1_935 [Enterospora canceri]